MLPDDPVEFLSEFLYKKSFEVDKEWLLSGSNKLSNKIKNLPNILFF